MRMQQKRLTFSSMIRYITLFLIIATCYGQESNNSWLDIVLEKSETPQNKEASINPEDDTTYFTIQVGIRKQDTEFVMEISPQKKMQIKYQKLLKRN